MLSRTPGSNGSKMCTCVICAQMPFVLASIWASIARDGQVALSVLVIQVSGENNS